MRPALAVGLGTLVLVTSLIVYSEISTLKVMYLGIFVLRVSYTIGPDWYYTTIKLQLKNVLQFMFPIRCTTTLKFMSQVFVPRSSPIVLEIETEEDQL